jgi:predicted nucleotidyltransferase
MRISSKIAEQLIVRIENLDPSLGSELFLFGSRTDDEKKGGDIDLLLVTDAVTRTKADSQKLSLRASLREAADDQRVDLSVITASELISNPFFSSLENRISLKRW